MYHPVANFQTDLENCLGFVARVVCLVVELACMWCLFPTVDCFIIAPAWCLRLNLSDILYINIFSQLHSANLVNADKQWREHCQQAALLFVALYMDFLLDFRSKRNVRNVSEEELSLLAHCIVRSADLVQTSLR